MKKLFTAAAVCILAVIISGVFIYQWDKTGAVGKSDQLIALNEIEQLAKSGDTELAAEKAELLSEQIRTNNVIESKASLFIICGLSGLIIAASFLYIYFAVIRPFDKLKNFAEKISVGNFDEALDYQRSNYFGAFTWAFDSMRREITKARSGEKEAIENNKTVIATLSHDIKTPISSIRAYAEGLEANMDTTPEKRKKYLSVIMSKCDEVSRLTNDLFLHSLSDMDKLKITPEKFELSAFLEKITSELAAERNDIHYKSEFYGFIYADKSRLEQLTENIINNARKYAKTDIDVFVAKNGGDAEIHFRDYGEGIPDEDMPFIFGKFYRGKNCGNEQGSGLGLYIADYIVKQSKGKILLHNHDGLEVTVSLPIIS